MVPGVLPSESPVTPESTATLPPASSTSSPPLLSEVPLGESSRGRAEAKVQDIGDKAETRGSDGLAESSSASASSALPGETSGEEKLQECRICLEPARDSEEVLVSPCACRGTTQYAHFSCLEKWVSAKGSLRCEICGNVYQDDILSRLRISPLVLDQRNPQGPSPPRQSDALVLTMGFMEPNGQQRWATVSTVRYVQDEQAGREDLDAAARLLLQRQRTQFWIRTGVLACLACLVFYLMMLVGNQEQPSFWTMLILRIVSFLLPIYLMARILSTFSRRRVQHGHGMS